MSIIVSIQTEIHVSISVNKRTSSITPSDETSKSRDVLQ